MGRLDLPAQLVKLHPGRLGRIVGPVLTETGRNSYEIMLSESQVFIW